MSYHSNQAAYFNLALNHQYKRRGKNSFFIVLSEEMRKENLEILVKLRLRITI